MLANGELHPAIIVGGDENALSVSRNLSRAGIPVYLLNRRSVPARYSRHGHWITVEGESDTPKDWTRFLLGGGSDHLAGAVLFACSDEAIELVVENWEALSSKFLLEECPPKARRTLLDKLATYECARDAGIPVPGFWVVQSTSDMQQVEQQCTFPVILKPRLSHHSARIGRKHLRASDRTELLKGYAYLAELGVSVVIMEFIPGGDHQLCSYYTYVDANGIPLIRFTKRVERRYPMNSGRATYHETTWNPDVAALGEQFFRHAGLKGLGNVEFKLDPRDGQLKIIEANARFTAADTLVSRSGIDFARFVYDRLIGCSPTPPVQYRTGMVLWYPLEDFLAFVELRRDRPISWLEWLRSVRRAEVFPYLNWRDPMPSVVNLVQRARSLRRIGKRNLSWGGTSDADRGALPRCHGTSTR
jgi:D-aspartate ligase